MVGFSRFVIGLVLGWLVVSIVLAVFEETRIDAYVSLSVLVYFMLVAIAGRELSVQQRWVLDFVLLTLFVVIVSYRVWLMLSG